MPTISTAGMIPYQAGKLRGQVEAEQEAYRRGVEKARNALAAAEINSRNWAAYQQQTAAKKAAKGESGGTERKHYGVSGGPKGVRQELTPGISPVYHPTYERAPSNVSKRVGAEQFAQREEVAQQTALKEQEFQEHLSFKRRERETLADVDAKKEKELIDYRNSFESPKSGRVYSADKKDLMKYELENYKGDLKSYNELLLNKAASYKSWRGMRGTAEERMARAEAELKEQGIIKPQEPESFSRWKEKVKETSRLENEKQARVPHEKNVTRYLKSEEKLQFEEEAARLYDEGLRTGNMGEYFSFIEQAKLWLREAGYIK